MTHSSAPVNDYGLDGKVAIVTGAARGIGRAHATALARAGAAVVASDVSDCSETVGAIEATGGRAIAALADVADGAAVQAMATQAVEAFGRIDVLVNNAALYGALHGGPFDRITEQEWDACMAVNVKGLWQCAKAVVPAMREQGGGSIVNISSLAAIYGMANGLHYVTSKAAVIGITRGLARELGRNWIRVNSIAPSAVETEGTSEFFGEGVDRAYEVIRNGQSLRRTLAPDDVADAMLFLAGQGSRFVTGQTLMVDGGTAFL